ncbi:hypothetical protein OC845_002573 [Tilletia horrida]|nr:hypothetical protein OC845_002573 [Tilletia horrida]
MSTTTQPAQTKAATAKTVRISERTDESLTSRAANAPAPQLQALNPFLHIYDPTATIEGSSSGSGHDASTLTTQQQALPLQHPRSKAHLPSQVAGVRAPAVILLFGFMDGPLRIMLKYASQYLARFPSSFLILQLSTGTGFLADQGTRSGRMQKVVSLLERAQDRAEARRALRRQIRSVERRAAERSLDSDEQRRLRRLKKHQQQRKNSMSMSQSQSSLSLSTSGLTHSVSTDSVLSSSSGGEGGGSGVWDEDEEDEAETDESYLPAEERTPSGLLIHSFSDGGGRNLWALLNELSSAYQAQGQQRNSRLPFVRGNIFDSSPGLQNPTTSSIAFTMPLVKRYPRWIVWIARISVWWYVRLALWWRVYVQRQPTDSQRMRAALNSPLKWAWGWKSSTEQEVEEGVEGLGKIVQQQQGGSGGGGGGGGAGRPFMQIPPRLYLYSKGDVLIPWERVEEHAQDAARIQLPGLRVEAELIVQEQADGGNGDGTSGVQAAAKAGAVDAELAKWAALSAKFDSSFSSPHDGNKKDTARRPPHASSPRVQERAGVRLVRWEKAPHCDIGRHDLSGYWASVDEWLKGV